METIAGTLEIEGLEKIAWFYDPAENELIIDRSDIEPDGFVWACHEERYRVEQRENKIILTRIGDF